MWSELIHELDQWAALGSVATFWWRDDDAEMPSAQLDTMLAVAGPHPICLAVVPGNLDLKPLADQLSPLEHITVLQHGWKHASNTHQLHGEHSGTEIFASTWQTHAGGIRSEYPEFRAFDEVSYEIGAGHVALRNAFGNQALPVLVPPFHIYSDRFLSILYVQGIPWISRGGPRRYWGKGINVLDSNIHVDLMDWSVNGLGDPHAKIKVMVNHLRSRRTGQIDISEPTGILTHHLYQDNKSWVFIAELLAITNSHGSVKWLGGREVFSCGTASRQQAAPL